MNNKIMKLLTITGLIISFNSNSLSAADEYQHSTSTNHNYSDYVQESGIIRYQNSLCKHYMALADKYKEKGMTEICAIFRKRAESLKYQKCLQPLTVTCAKCSEDTAVSRHLLTRLPKTHPNVKYCYPDMCAAAQAKYDEWVVMKNCNVGSAQEVRQVRSEFYKNFNKIMKEIHAKKAKIESINYKVSANLPGYIKNSKLVGKLEFAPSVSEKPSHNQFEDFMISNALLESSKEGGILLISGHSDLMEMSKDNNHHMLAHSRAMKAKSILEAYGVDKSSIHILSFGASMSNNACLNIPNGRFNTLNSNKYNYSNIDQIACTKDDRRAEMFVIQQNCYKPCKKVDPCNTNVVTKVDNNSECSKCTKTSCKQYCYKMTKSCGCGCPKHHCNKQDNSCGVTDPCKKRYTKKCHPCDSHSEHQKRSKEASVAHDSASHKHKSSTYFVTNKQSSLKPIKSTSKQHEEFLHKQQQEHEEYAKYKNHEMGEEGMNNHDSEIHKAHKRHNNAHNDTMDNLEEENSMHHQLDEDDEMNYDDIK